MLLDSIAGVLKVVLRSRRDRSREVTTEQPVVALKSIGFDDFLAINMPPRGMLLNPVLPERSLAMLYAPRGVSKTSWLFRWVWQSPAAPPSFVGSIARLRSGKTGLSNMRHASAVCFMLMAKCRLFPLQERLRAISTGLSAVIPNDGFRILAADNTENDLSIGSENGATGDSIRR